MIQRTCHVSLGDAADYVVEGALVHHRVDHYTKGVPPKRGPLSRRRHPQLDGVIVVWYQRGVDSYPSSPCFLL